MQEGDVLLFQTIDDGDILVEGGLVRMTRGLETAVYLSLFGGNEDGSVWWGDTLETEAAYQYKSETQNLLSTLPISSGNLLRIEDAAKRDLSWITTTNIASSVDVSTSIVGLNKVRIEVRIDDISSIYDLPWGTT